MGACIDYDGMIGWMRRKIGWMWRLGLGNLNKQVIKLEDFMYVHSNLAVYSKESVVHDPMYLQCVF